MLTPRIEVKVNAHGGDGQITMKHLLSDNEMHGKCRLYAEVTIYPGSSLGYHEHEGENETYYILSGEAEYQDDAVTKRVSAGDITFTPSGHGHGIKPIGNEPVVFMALIICD